MDSLSSHHESLLNNNISVAPNGELAGSCLSPQMGDNRSRILENDVEVHEEKDALSNQKHAAWTNNHSDVTSWPQKPQLLQRSLQKDLFSITAVSLLPILFLVIGFCAIGLDKKPRSSFGDNVIEVSKYGTTAFPIIFTAVVAGLMKTLALWRCEKGIKLGSLEQLLGSQSLAGTLERFVMLRRFNVHGSFIILLWILSPVGSQMTLRLLTLTSLETLSMTPLQYFNTITPVGDSPASTFESAFESPSTMSSDKAAMLSLIGSSIMSSDNVRKSSLDSWNNVKVPCLENLSPESPWIEVNETFVQPWVSLSGIMIQGLPASGISTFIIESSYINAHCPDSVRLLADTKTLKASNYNLQINKNSSTFWTNYTLFLDTLSFDNSTFDTPLSLIYGSKIGSLEYTPGGSNDIYVELYNCTITTPIIEGNVSCDGPLCRIHQIRLLKKDGKSPFAFADSLEVYKTFLDVIPEFLGTTHIGFPSPLDLLMQGFNSPYSVIGDIFSLRYSNISGKIFEKRLTTLLNTVWQASMCASGISLGSSINFTLCTGLNNSISVTAETRTTIPQAKYIVNKIHVALLLVITVILQVCAISTLVLRTLTKAPDILGYVSSMTRDNPHANFPDGGNILDGIERSRYLADVNVCLSDIQSDKDIGHISFTNYEKIQLGKLNKKRRYL